MSLDQMRANIRHESLVQMAREFASRSEPAEIQQCLTEVAAAINPDSSEQQWPKMATTHLRLRVDAARLATLETAAAANGRTLTGEIIHRLDESFKRQNLVDVVEALADRVVEKIVERIRPESQA